MIPKNERGTTGAPSTSGSRIFLSKEKSIQEVIESDPTISTIVALVAINGYIPEVADVLSREWPDRFPPYEKLVRMLPQFIPTVGYALVPLHIPSSGRLLQNLYTTDISAGAKRDIGRLLVRIGIEQYQSEFQKDPDGTLAKLHRQTENAKRVELREIYEQVQSHYRNVFEFNIPGYGTLKERR